MTQLYKGSCLCVAITFEAGDFDPEPAHCHCTMCRKFHGAAFGTLVEAEAFRLLSGEEHLRHYTGHNGTVRTFCDVCGSSIAFRGSDDPELPYELAISLFDEALPIRFHAHIYMDYSANWFDMTDHLPRFAEGRGREGD